MLIIGSIGGSVLTEEQALATGQGLGTFDPLFRELNPDVDWGGFLLTMIIAVFAIVVSFPIGLVMALGRRSTISGIPPWLTYPLAIGVAIWGLLTRTPAAVDQARNTLELIVAYWPLAIPIVAYLFQRVWKGNVVAAFSTLYIEFIRGIPLITVLFLSIILFPIFLPPNVEILNVWRVMWGFTLFTAAYLAENVRGGLQAIPNGQYEAADSLGLSTFDKYRLIILPQALRIVIPAMTNNYIGLFKDTTLVAIVGLLDILGIANTISSQPAWLGVRREAYLFIGLLYYIISALMAGYSARLEKRTGLGER
jgi:general L-amino acid transport system permease protein